MVIHQISDEQMAVSDIAIIQISIYPCFLYKS